MGAVLKYWNGSAWVAKPLKYWTGSAWATKTLKYWNGSAWIGGVGTSYADTFDRANANLEASAVASGGWSWVHDGAIAGALAISSNQINCATTNSTGSAYKTPSLGTADHYVQYKTVSVSISTGPFACCRLQDNANFIGIRCGNGGSNGQIEVYRRNAGTLTSMHASAGSSFVVGDIIRLEVSGTTFTVKKNGVLFTSGSIGGTAITAQTAGLLGRTTTGIHFEDFQAGTL